ncbi:NHL repeat family protein [Mycobacterium xenopi 4042]|uniref:NHL repeat family protein n=1 Tax=Mycobacterium xenopi 4042 TaxID=1299334 RepID=X7ZWN8_MYCXE|nr:NHL repeat family protein [Mycobacterium xenopi 4042]
MAWMYSPRGVFIDEHHLVVADSGNHRVLIWHGLPTADEQSADVVLGQPDGTTEGRAAGGRGPANGMNLPTGVLVHDGRLLVADAWHHRILVWNTIPEISSTPPDFVLGQPDDLSVNPNGAVPVRLRRCTGRSELRWWAHGCGLLTPATVGSSAGPAESRSPGGRRMSLSVNPTRPVERRTAAIGWPGELPVASRYRWP